MVPPSFRKVLVELSSDRDISTEVVGNPSRELELHYLDTRERAGS